METKICRKCLIDKELSFYPKDKNRKDGYYVYCKECRKINYNENNEKRREKSKEWYHNNKEKSYQKQK